MPARMKLKRERNPSAENIKVSWNNFLSKTFMSYCISRIKMQTKILKTASPLVGMPHGEINSTAALAEYNLCFVTEPADRADPRQSAGDPRDSVQSPPPSRHWLHPQPRSGDLRRQTEGPLHRNQHLHWHHHSLGQWNTYLRSLDTRVPGVWLP